MTEQVKAATFVSDLSCLEDLRKYEAVVLSPYDVSILSRLFHNENEPIVCTPAEATDCFARTDMDVLVLGSYVVDRGGKR